VPSAQDIVLKFSCADQPGIVAAVANFFRDQGFNIRESSQFEDSQTGQFFMRTEFQWLDRQNKNTGISLTDLCEQFAAVAVHYQM